jgi:hypothetical protein
MHVGVDPSGSQHRIGMLDVRERSVASRELPAGTYVDYRVTADHDQVVPSGKEPDPVVDTSHPKDRCAD